MNHFIFISTVFDKQVRYRFTGNLVNDSLYFQQGKALKCSFPKTKLQKSKSKGAEIQ